MVYGPFVLCCACLAQAKQVDEAEKQRLVALKLVGLLDLLPGHAV